MILTAWIPLIAANEKNGTLHVLPDGHRSGRVAKHQCCWGGTWYISLEEEEMKKTLGVDADDHVVVPVPYGGMILFSNVLPHRSGTNLSSEIRWSLDLRWNRADRPAGFWGLKDPVKLRSAHPNFTIDWETFNADEEEFDTTIVGPWMEKWEIVHMNEHTKMFAKNMQEGQASVPLVVG